MGVHDGHRKRMKARFLAGGADQLQDHELLELLLYYALPRADTNVIAHRLLERFGSLSAVFDAPLEELTQVSGIGGHAALLIKLVPAAGRRYILSRGSFDDILDTTEKAGRYLLPYFFTQLDEVVYMVCLDAKHKVITCRLMGHGSVNSANISVRKIVETALLYNASGVILAHNHTSGIAVPSREDEETTRRVAAALRAVDVELIDHLVVADNDFVSMADDGRL